MQEVSEKVFNPFSRNPITTNKLVEECFLRLFISKLLKNY